MESLEQLYLDQLKDMYNAEKQILKALPKMSKAATTPELRQAFESHLQQTEGHVDRLEQVFTESGRTPSGKKCEAMAGILEEGQSLMKEDAEGEVLDAALICAAQKVEHYEIATYGTLKTFARTLGLDRSSELLEQTLNEEKAADQKLTSIAESGVNAHAQTR